MFLLASLKPEEAAMRHPVRDPFLTLLEVVQTILALLAVLLVLVR